MLTNLTFNNFKSWHHSGNMPISPITGLFGANSTGKSSIIQFLLLLKQSVENADRSSVLDFGNEDSLANLGSFLNIIHNRNTEESLSFSVDWSTPSPLVIRNPENRLKTLMRSDKIRFEANIHGISDRFKAQVESFSYTLDESEFSYKLHATNMEEYSLGLRNLPGFKFKRSPGRKWPLPHPVKFYGFPDEVRTYHENASFLSDLDLEFEKMLRNVLYLGPLREYPRREYKWAGGDPADMGRRGEFAIAAILASRESGHVISRGKGKARFSLEEYVAFWLKEMQLIESFRIEEIKPGTNIYQVFVRRSEGSPEVLITDVGFGVSQVLPVLVLAYYAPEGSTILFEQPEIHLHPSVQSLLADVFIDAHKVRGVQFIIESHSEHLLRRLQRRIADESISENEIGMYFCSIAKGESSLNKLEVDLHGNIMNWPEDFFGNEFEDLQVISQSMQRRPDES